MKIHFVLLLLAIVLPAASQQPAPQPPATLKVKSRIVVVDVVVTDSKGNAVHGLKTEDFHLQEDKQPQTIRHFEEHTAAPTSSPLVAQPKLPPNTFTNIITAPEGSALNVIVFDSLNTPLEEQLNLHAQLKSVVDSLQAGTRVAVFGIGNRLVMLQGFTSDPAVLKAALTRRRGSLSTTMAMSANGSYEAPDYDPGSPLAQFDSHVQTFYLRERAERTLTALEQLSRYLAALPGRKNLIWASGSFALNYILDVGSLGPGSSSPFDSAADFSSELRQVSIELAKSQVAVYPIDSHGITVDSAYTAASGSTIPGALQRDPGRQQRISMQASAQLASERATMFRLADETGGHAFVDTNDIAGAVVKAINMGANYYTLTYIPSNSNWDGKTRKIKVALDGRNDRLSYRTSYIAADNPVTASNQQTTPGAERTKNSTLVATMRRGDPDPAEIVLSVRVTPSGVINPPANAQQPAEGEKLAAVSLHAQRRYRIDYAVDPQDVNWQIKDGKRSATLEFMIIGYNNDNQTVNNVSRTVPLYLSEPEFAQALHGGLRLSQEIAMPAKGEYYLRVGVLDKSNNHIGTVEISTATLEYPKQ